MTTIQTELSVIVPKELSMNLDYWNQIRENINLIGAYGSGNGICYIPSAFYIYLSKKYGYNLELLKSEQIYISNICFNLSKNLDKFKNISVSNNDIYNYGSFKPISKVKSRDDLINEIPIAEFD